MKLVSTLSFLKIYIGIDDLSVLNGRFLLASSPSLLNLLITSAITRLDV